MNSGLGNMLGRPELSPGYGGIMVSSDGTASPVQIGGTMFQASGSNTISGDVSVGQMSAGMLMAGVLVLILFYGWTRSAQK